MQRQQPRRKGLQELRAYKEYYNNLKKKYNAANLEHNRNSYDRFIGYRGENLYKQNRKKSKSSFIENLILVQLLGTIMLFFLAFGGKYTSNQDIKSYYKKFKIQIEQESTYTITNINLKQVNIESLKNKLLKYIDTIKETLVNDDFTN